MVGSSSESSSPPLAGQASSPAGAARGQSVRSARAALFVALILAAGAALFVQPEVVGAVRADRLAAGWLVAAPAIFSVVVVMAAMDAWRTARRRGYFRGPNVMLLAGCVAFMGLLLPTTFSEYRTRTSPPVESEAWHQALMGNRDPRVRALVMEVAGLNPELIGAPALLARGLDDPDPLVVKTAVAAVELRAGLRLDPATARERARSIVDGWRQAP